MFSVEDQLNENHLKKHWIKTKIIMNLINLMYHINDNK